MVKLVFGADQMPVSRPQSTDLKRRAPLRNIPAQPGYRTAVPFNLRPVAARGHTCRPDRAATRAPFTSFHPHPARLFAPALAAVGLHPDRVIYAETHRGSEVLAVAEEGLRQKGLAGVVAEVARLGLTASRRLQLAAEESGVPALIIRRWRTTTPMHPCEASTELYIPGDHLEQVRP